MQKTDGTFSKTEQRHLAGHKAYEDIDALFFDADRNGTQDLYVVSGGNFDQTNSHYYWDRLYLNDGFGNFRYTPDALPETNSSGGTVVALDYDSDGDLDLFVGGRVLTGLYPASPRSYLLRNDDGKFTDVTGQTASDLVSPGMVTDAVWFDTDGNGRNELVIAGEWMPIRIFDTENGEFREITEEAGFGKTNGLWNVLEVADVNSDGLPDLLAGNLGLNHSLSASEENPAILYYGDFNNNGLNDPLITYVTNGKRVPFPDRDLFLRQVSGFGDDFPTYQSWAESDINNILTRSQRSNATQYTAHTFATSVFINQGSGTFKAGKLPSEIQTAPVYDFFTGDFFSNQKTDILAVGNNYGTRPEIDPIANNGIFLKSTNKTKWDVISPSESGFYAFGDVRDIEIISTAFGPLFFLGRYGEPLMVYLYQGIQEEQ